jgi:hypothetical protein
MMIIAALVSVVVILKNGQILWHLNQNTL